MQASLHGSSKVYIHTQTRIGTTVSDEMHRGIGKVSGMTNFRPPSLSLRLLALIFPENMLSYLTATAKANDRGPAQRGALRPKKCPIQVPSSSR